MCWPDNPPIDEDPEPTLAQLSSEPVGPNPMDDAQPYGEFVDASGGGDSVLGRSLPYAEPFDALKLLDEIVPEFIEFVKEYHLQGWTESRDVKKCHLCQKLAKAEAYLDARKKQRA